MLMTVTSRAIQAKNVSHRLTNYKSNAILKCSCTDGLRKSELAVVKQINTIISL